MALDSSDKTSNMADQASWETPTKINIYALACAIVTPTKINIYALACAIVASTISIILGYTTGVISGAIVFIKKDLNTSDTQIEILAGILNLGALFGSLLAGRTSDIIGRRLTLVFASLLLTVGSVLTGWGPNYGILLTGRLIAGVGVGFALTIAPVYSAEISATSYRGFLTSLPHLCIGLGILLGYLINYFFSKLPLNIGWRLMLGIAAVPSVVLAIGVLKMPESPRWLVLQGKLGEAKRILLLVSNTKEEAENRFRDIKLAAKIDENSTEETLNLDNKKSNGEDAWKELIRPTPAVRRILITALGIQFFQQATGIEAVILYGPEIFKTAGVKTESKIMLATVGIGITTTVFNILATFLVDKVGRRMLLLTGLAGMVCASSALGFGLTMAQHFPGKLLWALVLCIVATYGFMVVFSMGIGPVTWVYCAEVFPLRLRAQGSGLGVAVNRITNATFAMTFLSLANAITAGGAFFMFAGIAFVAWWFFFFLMPETRGKNLEQIELLFDTDRANGHVAMAETVKRKTDV